MAKITVVVPVYKVPFEYLDQCLKSILNQTFTDIEVIIVDDGSPEEWFVKCDSFCEIDKRVRVIHKKNGGLSDARNSGLKQAQSEWITFVDGDDWIDEAFFETFMSLIQKENETADIYYFSGYRNYPNKELEGVPYFNNGLRFITYKEREELQTRCFTNHISKEGNTKGITISSAWAKIYRTTFLINNDLYFPIVPYDEDSLYYLETLEKANAIEYISRPVYHYRYTDGSIVNRYRPDAVREQEIYLNYIFDFARRNEKSQDFVNKIYSRVFTSMLLLIKQYFYHTENKANLIRRHVQCRELFKKEPYFSAIRKLDINDMRRNSKIKFFLIKLKLYGIVEVGRRITHKSLSD